MIDTLFSKCVKYVCQDFNRFRTEIDNLPESAICELYAELVKAKEFEALERDLVKLNRFVKLLRVIGKRHVVHSIFQGVVNHQLSELTLDQNQNCEEITFRLLGNRLAYAYTTECFLSEFRDSSNKCYNVIQIGIELGGFLYDAGWLRESAGVLQQCLVLCLTKIDVKNPKPKAYYFALRCFQKLLMAQSSYSLFREAQTTMESAKLLIEKLKKDQEYNPNLAGVYSAFAALSFAESRYNDAIDWSKWALKELDDSLDYPLIIDILRQSSKACVVKREFGKAELLITEAVYLARDTFGPKSVKYADTLLDYGFYLLNRDSVPHAATVYFEALRIRLDAFGKYNLYTGIAYEELAYALYVKEYNTGNFTDARKYSEQAIEIMNTILSQGHLQLASAKRVKALILEEIAIDSTGSSSEKELLYEAQKLHFSALNLSIDVFGEMNVQTAKHYGNLGRLYQSMKRYQDAEDMHIKAISIKEKILGLYDYEVALSVGHLASLYNYDMMQFKKAEALHLRSITIGRRLFGDSYSGLEYDYRGLLQVYSMEGNAQKIAEYSQVLSQWKRLRDLKTAQSQEMILPAAQLSRPFLKVINEFFETYQDSS